MAGARGWAASRTLADAPFWQHLSDWRRLAEDEQFASFVAEWSQPPRSQYLLGGWTVLALLTAGLAKSRRRSAMAWLLLGLLFPLLSAIAVLLLRKRTPGQHAPVQRVVIRKDSDKAIQVNSRDHPQSAANEKVWIPDPLGGERCAACDALVPSGTGYVINAIVSSRYAANLKASRDAQAMMRSFGCHVKAIRRDQILACSDDCAGRAVGSDAELAMARRAAKIWWEERKQGKDVYVTQTMLQRGWA